MVSSKKRRGGLGGLGAVFMAVSPGSGGVLGRVRRAVDKTRGRPERVDGRLLGFLAGGWLALVGAWKLAGLDGGAAVAIGGSCLAIGLAAVAIWDLILK